MKKWAYVVCDLVGVDEYPSFRHTFVVAPDEETAYEEGHRTVRQPAGSGLNDYVFELPSCESTD